MFGTIGLTEETNTNSATGNEVKTSENEDMNRILYSEERLRHVQYRNRNR
jgi:hypothetical protein